MSELLHDVVIVGGGLAGAACAAALRSSSLSVALVEGRVPEPPPDAWDARIYAISPANAAFLSDIGAWERLDASRITPVHRMEIHGDRGGKLEFSAFDCGVDELAWIVESGLVQRGLWDGLKHQPNVTIYAPARPERLDLDAAAVRLALADGTAIAARLVVGADGADSWVRTQAGIGAHGSAYGELAVVANLACDKPHENTAFQWFRADGVLAYLPLPGSLVSIVWSAPEEHAEALLAADPAGFCDQVREAAGGQLGDMRLVTPARGFPLRLMRVERTVAPRLALIGDAAHTIHPLSGHGINLGFQDARVLAQALDAAAPLSDPGSLPVLRRYERGRAEEVLALQAVTHALQRLFRPRAMPLAILRNLGLNLTNALPVVRNMLARYAMG